MLIRREFVFQVKWCFVVFQILCFFSVHGAIQGKVSGNTYLSPGDLFKMQIPNKYNVKQHIQDRVMEGVTMVGFRNDYGNGVNVEVYDISQEEAKKLKVAENKEEFTAMVLEFLDVSEGAKRGFEVLRKEYFFDERLGNAFFLVRRLSGGSGVVALEQGKESDSKQGYLCTFSDNHIVLVIIQESPIEDYIAQLIQKHANQGSGEHPTEDLRSQLVNVRRSITFLAKPAA